MDNLVPNPSLYNIPFRTQEFNGMPYRNLGTSGIRVSNIGLGTWKIGYPETGDESRIDEKRAFQLFDRAVELGVTFWDTANRYNNASGNSERVIGNWLKQNADQRRNIVLATKLFGNMDGISPNHNGLSRSNILDSVYASLTRMQIDHIDVLFFHGFDELTPIEESLAAIEDLVQQRLIRYFAVSNFTLNQLSAYRTVADKMSVRCRILAVQNQYDLLQGEMPIRQGVLKYAAETGISFISWSPLARGLLTNRYLDLTKVGPGDRLYDEGDLKKGLSQDIQQKIQRLAALSKQHGLELSQLVIAYMLSIPGMGPLIPSSSTLQQLESNAAAGSIILNDEQKNQVAEIVCKEM
jgi:aryl-alcohol dehydrogenase-like predicted oxidoreductase